MFDWPSVHKKFGENVMYAVDPKQRASDRGRDLKIPLGRDKSFIRNLSMQIFPVPPIDSSKF